MAPTRGVTTYNVRLRRGIPVVTPLVGAMQRRHAIAVLLSSLSGFVLNTLANEIFKLFKQVKHIIVIISAARG